MRYLPKKAMVLAAGLGKRMRPLTNTMPKPMIEVAGRSMVERALDALEAAGVEEVVINTSYLAEVLETHLSKRFSPHIIFSREDEPLETGGGVLKALPLLGNHPFFIVNGDIICMNGATPFLQRLADVWHDTLDAALLIHPVQKAFGYDGKGDFDLDALGGLTRLDTPSHEYVFTGIQIMHPRVFDGITDTVFSLNVIYQKLMQSAPERIAAVVHDGEWLHIGDPKAKREADDYLLNLAC